MSIRAAGLVGLLFALSSVAAAAADDKKTDEKLLVGKWKLTKLSTGDLPPGVEIVLDIKEDGTFKIIETAGDQKDENTATWKLDNRKLTMEFTDGSRKGSKQTDEVKELTEKKLVLHDANDVTEEWERVPEKKTDK